MRDNIFEELEETLERMGRQVEEEVQTEATPVEVDVRDDGEAYTVLANLPGYDADDVDLELRGQRLEITAERTGERREEGTDDGASYVRRERRRQSVSRTVSLPEEVEAAEVDAALDEGVLTVTLPKAHEDVGREIEIDD